MGNGKRVKPINQKRREEMQEALVIIFVCRKRDMGKEQRETGNGRNGKRQKSKGKRETGHRGNGKWETGKG